LLFWTKGHIILEQCRGLIVVANAFLDCLYHVTFRGYLPVCLEVIAKIAGWVQTLAFVDQS